MPVLQHFPTARQADPNSCWACAAREIVNWYNRLGLSGGQSYVSDQALADVWAVASHNNVHADIHMQQSAAAALEDLRFRNNTDDHPLPTRDEISDEIHRGRPLLAIVGNALPVPSPNPDYQNGHWVVIVGIVQLALGYKLHVFDPDDGVVHHVDYDAALYRDGMYWQNTSYVDPYP